MRRAVGYGDGDDSHSQLFGPTEEKVKVGLFETGSNAGRTSRKASSALWCLVDPALLDQQH
jgi:hypothetical protein